jgi:dATP/dGTP diphosphohydrolase
MRISNADLIGIIYRQREFSGKTFGPGKRTKGIIDHIKKELVEIEESKGDLSEWIDVIILALDAAWRTGATPSEIVEALCEKMSRNATRKWPDWRTVPKDVAIEHER